MQHRRKASPAALQSEERRLREDAAPRLASEVPGLVTLKLFIEDRSSASPAQPKYVRHIVVEHAPALFLIGCTDPNCRDGGHDVTGPVMRALGRRETAFEGDDSCTGALGPNPCLRVLHYQAVATYALHPRS